MSLSLTALILCHRNASFLAKAAGSLGAQTVRPNRVMILATDALPGTASIVKHEASRISAEIHVTERALNCADSKNLAAELAESDAFFILDADDYLAPQFVEACLGGMEQTGADVVGCDYFQEQDGRTCRAVLVPVRDVRTANPLPACSLVRKAAFVRTRGYRELLYDDWALWITLAYLGCRLERVPQPLFYYVRHPAAKTQPGKHLQAMRQIHGYMRELNERGLQ
jgi:hypothetical protein